MSDKPQEKVSFVCKNQELCVDGNPHDFSGDMVYFTADGYETTDQKESCGGSVVCQKCGLDAMSHTMRYGP